MDRSHYDATGNTIFNETSSAIVKNVFKINVVQCLYIKYKADEEKKTAIIFTLNELTILVNGELIRYQWF